MGKAMKRRYTSEFKQQAAELASRIGGNKAAHQLGIAASTVQIWRKNMDNKEPQTKKEKVNLEEENRLLKRENDELKKVNQILKKAAAFFSQDHLK